MKLLLTLLLSITYAYADDLRIGSLVNYHTFLNLPNMHNKITDNGRLVLSPVFTEYRTNDYDVFATTECMGQFTAGVAATQDLIRNYEHRLSIFEGVYFIQTKNWYKYANSPVYWVDLNDSIGFVPIIGIRDDQKLLRYDNISIDLTTVITPALVQAGLFVNIRY
jgi:hypothetical protein